MLAVTLYKGLYEARHLSNFVCRLEIDTFCDKDNGECVVDCESDALYISPDAEQL
jgi:hypothetical protein